MCKKTIGDILDELKPKKYTFNPLSGGDDEHTNLHDMHRQILAMERERMQQLLDETMMRGTGPVTFHRPSSIIAQDAAADMAMIEHMQRLREIEQRTMRQRTVEMSGHARATGKSRFLTDWAADHLRNLRSEAAPSLSLDMNDLKQGMLDGTVTVTPAPEVTTDTITIPAGSVLTYTTESGDHLTWITTTATDEDGIGF